MACNRGNHALKDVARALGSTLKRALTALNAFFTLWPSKFTLTLLDMCQRVEAVGGAWFHSCTRGGYAQPRTTAGADYRGFTLRYCVSVFVSYPM